MKSFSVLLCGVAVSLIAACASTVTPENQFEGVVETASGHLAGTAAGDIIVFKGIPFAQPPVSALRWRAPQPVSWPGILPADSFSPACPQPLNADGTPNGGGYAGPISEDCLYLNIWAPREAENAPIMVFLYGGGGVVGAGSLPTYDGSAFAQDGIILVTINYRLGALAGFAHPSLTAEAGQSPSTNFHLLDAIAALSWVKENAGAFGGDPDNILLFGQSAGATMTANLVTSPMAEGLFSKAIFESTGSLLTPATPLALAKERGRELARDLGLPYADASPEALRALEARTILAHPKYGFGARTILDGKVKTQTIADSFRDGNAQDVLLMVGTNSDEGRLAGTNAIAAFAEDGAPVWQYFFDYVPEALRGQNPNGAPHSAELPFVFNTLETYPALAGAITPEDRRAAALVHSCWKAFARAKAGDTVLECGDGFSWPARSAANAHAVAIFQAEPSLGRASELRSPPNGAEPGPSHRDD
ncbi:MAG: carboxylesterase/lipase family protein [Hyphomonas sp.]